MVNMPATGIDRKSDETQTQHEQTSNDFGIAETPTPYYDGRHTRRLRGADGSVGRSTCSARGQHCHQRSGAAICRDSHDAQRRSSRPDAPGSLWSECAADPEAAGDPLPGQSASASSAKQGNRRKKNMQTNDKTFDRRLTVGVTAN